MKLKVITFTNQKGGIGKTTSATTVANILQSKGYKTLLIDADEAANSTDAYSAVIKDQATLYDVILDDDPIPLAEAIQHTPSGDIVAGDSLLRKAEVVFKEDMTSVFRFKERIAELEGYDFVIIDTHPSINSMLHSTLIASDYVVIPVAPDRFSVVGIEPLIKTINSLKQHFNPGLTVAGLLLVRYNKGRVLSRTASEALETVAKANGIRFFETKIRETESVKQSQVEHVPLLEYAPRCNAALDYYVFVEELLHAVK